MNESGSNDQDGLENPGIQQEAGSSSGQQAHGSAQQSEGADSHQSSDSPDQGGDIGGDESPDAGDSGSSQPGGGAKRKQAQHKGDEQSPGSRR